MPRSSWKRWLLFAVFCVLLGVGWSHLEIFSTSYVREMVLYWGVWGPVGFVGLYALGSILFVPDTIFLLLGGLLFGPVLGSIVNIVGATVGASISFLLSRYLVGDWVTSRATGKLRVILTKVETLGWRIVALCEVL